MQNDIVPKVQLKLRSVYTQEKILNGFKLCLFLGLNRLFGFVCSLKFLGWLVGLSKGKATFRHAAWEVCREREKQLSVIAKVGTTMSL